MSAYGEMGYDRLICLYFAYVPAYLNRFFVDSHQCPGGGRRICVVTIHSAASSTTDASRIVPTSVFPIVIRILAYLITRIIWIIVLHESCNKARIFLEKIEKYQHEDR